MQVTIAAPLITVTKVDGGTVQINGSQVNTVRPFKGTTYNAPAYAPAVAPPGDDTGIGMGTTDRWGVVINLTNGREEQFFLDQVTNQPGWVNTLVGANQAVTDISAAL